MLAQASEGVRAAVLEGASSVAAQAAALLRAVIEELTETCSSVLKQLRGITATYRYGCICMRTCMYQMAQQE